jgi:cyclin C
MSVRQQALATAQVYVRRFYTRREIRTTNPWLVLSTAFYLACKMEECPQHIRIVVGEARQFWPGITPTSSAPLRAQVPRLIHLVDAVSSDTSKLGECEFQLISEMNSQLIVHHPYRDLTELQTLFALTSEETSLAWSIVNDHFLTDLPLLYAPHIIAITAVFLSLVLKPVQGGAMQAQAVQNALQQAMNVPAGGASAGHTKVQKLLNWIAEGSVSIEAIIDCTQELISLYELWEHYQEKPVKEAIMKFVKARGLDK